MEFSKDIDKLDKPVDKTEWYMSPQTVNAITTHPTTRLFSQQLFCNHSFYNYQADEAVNYGGMEL
jgi:endothelin-converting enzyme/putative endopeptidase